MPAIRSRFPQLKLQLAEEKTADILRLLDDGKLDAGLLALPVEDETIPLNSRSCSRSRSSWPCPFRTPWPPSAKSGSMT